MSDPLSKIRQFLAEKTPSLELAKLAIERDRRKEIKPRLRRDPGLEGNVSIS